MGTPARGEAAPVRPPGDIASLTSLRGLLAVWVVLYHFWNDVVRLFPSAEAVSPLVRVGDLAVPAFFLLSGFVLAYNYGDRFGRWDTRAAVRFLGLRLARVYPVHLVSLLAVLAMVVVSGRLGYQLTDSGYTARDFVLNLLLMQTWVPDFTLNWNYPAWSISSEWFAYLVFPLAVRVGLRHLTSPLRAAVAGTVAVAGAIAVMVWWRPWPFYELVLVVPTFFAGATVYWLLLGRIGAGRSAVGRWVPVALVLAAVAVTFTRTPALVSGALLVCSIGLIVALAWLGGGCHRIWTVRPVVALGEVSYSLYMTHTLAQKVVYKLLPSSRFVDSGPVAKVGVLVVYAVLVLAFCLATYYLVERPCRTFFKNRTARPGVGSGGGADRG